MSFEEQSRESAQLRGDGWHTLAKPRIVEAYLASAWMNVIATDVNEQTGAIRVEYPTANHGMRKFILNGSQYRAREGLFAQEHD